MTSLMILWSTGVILTCIAALLDLSASRETRSRTNRLSNGIALTLLLIGGAANICLLAGWL